MSKIVEVNIGKQGRLVIPAGLRRSLDLHEGDKLIAREEAGRLVLEKLEIIQQRLRARFATAQKVLVRNSLINDSTPFEPSLRVVYQRLLSSYQDLLTYRQNAVLWMSL